MRGKFPPVPNPERAINQESYMPDPGTVGAVISGTAVSVSACILISTLPVHVCLRRHCQLRMNSQSDGNYTETIQARRDGMNSGNAGGPPLFSRVVSVQSNRAVGLDWSTTSAAKTAGSAPVKLQPVRGAQPFPVVKKRAPVPSAPPFPAVNKRAPVPSAPPFPAVNKRAPVPSAPPFPAVNKRAPVPSAPPFPVFNKQAPVPCAPIVQQPRVKPPLL